MVRAEGCMYFTYASLSWNKEHSHRTNITNIHFAKCAEFPGRELWALLDADQVVIAAGGGGIPVLQQGSHLKGASAIIEKDYTAAKLAELVGAGTLLFLTAYDKLTIGKGTPEEKVFDTVSATDLHQYIKDGHFPAVTTFPKVDASIRFVTADKERKAVIANLEKAKEGLAGKTGTTITA